MDDTKQFALDCADFLRKKMFTSNVTPENLLRRSDALVYLVAQNMLGIAQNMLSDGPRLPTIADMVMGTKGPVGPHLEQLVAYLRKRELTADFFKAMPTVGRVIGAT
jgi:hypothetical protein